MNALEQVVRDIRDVLGDDAFRRLAGLSSADPFDSMHRQISSLAHNCTDLSKWLATRLGSWNMQRLLENLEIAAGSSESCESLVDIWLSFRGIGDSSELPVRPLQLTEHLKEAARQASGAADKYDSRRLLAKSLELLLRYIAFYYRHEILKIRPLATESEQASIVGTANESPDLGAWSLPELCRWLDIASPVAAKPYEKHCANEVTLGSAVAHQSLALLASATEDSSIRSPEQNDAFASAVLTLLDEWLNDRLVPMGCVVRSYSQTYLSVATCISERHQTLRVQVPKNSLSVQDSILLQAVDEANVWAPRVVPLPKGPEWTMHRQSGPGSGGAMEPARDLVFISYSHEDASYRDELVKMLKPLVRSGQIKHFVDAEMKPGTKWKDEIESAIKRTRVCVFLVSSSFLASDFIDQKEVPPLRQGVDDGSVKMVWVLVSHCMWKQTWIEQYQGALPVASALNRVRDRDAAWVKIGEAILAAYSR